MLKQAIKWGAKNPGRLFLLDGAGATLSAFMLGIILVKWEKYFGIPPSTLYLLASLPVLFAIYDFYCYRLAGEKKGLLLKVIAILNLAYCVLSIGFAVYHTPTITKLGLAYIGIEILIVAALSTIEYKVAKNIIT